MYSKLKVGALANDLELPLSDSPEIPQGTRDGPAPVITSITCEPCEAGKSWAQVAQYVNGVCLR